MQSVDLVLVSANCLLLIVKRNTLLLQVSNGDLAEAVAFLTEKNAKVPQQDETTYYQTSQVASDRYISVGSQADTSEQLVSTSGTQIQQSLQK